MKLLRNKYLGWLIKSAKYQKSDQVKSRVLKPLSQKIPLSYITIKYLVCSKIHLQNNNNDKLDFTFSTQILCFHGYPITVWPGDGPAKC